MLILTPGVGMKHVLILLLFLFLALAVTLGVMRDTTSLQSPVITTLR